jgi:hypothetical protein
MDDSNYVPDPEESEVLSDESDDDVGGSSMPVSTASGGTISTSGRRTKKRKKSSWVFNHFVPSDRNDPIFKWVCTVPIKFPSSKPCNHSYSRSTSTTTLAGHLKKKHKLSSNPNAAPPGQMVFHNSGKCALPDILPNDEKASIFEALVNWIVDDKQAFRVVENLKFQRLIRRLNPLYRIPSRRTVVRGIADGYEVALQNFREIISTIPGRVAITCDGWSSSVIRGYFVVTLHWIDTEWRQRSSVLEFKYFPPPHNMHTTSSLLLRILDTFNLNTKIRAITTDSGGEMPPA